MQTEQARAMESLARGLAFLAQAQGKDGGWHSAVYGQLKGGAGLTALILQAASLASPELLSFWKVPFARGFRFLEPGLAKKGTVASPDGSLDYPTYGAALWLLASRDRADQSAQRLAVVNYLLGAQCVEGRGFNSTSPSYGGWDLFGQADAQGVTTGTNISVTCHVLEALAGELSAQETKNDSANPLLAKLKRSLSLAGKWVASCQQPDSGFAFTPEPLSLNNKAAYREDAPQTPRSYGTATADGVRALMALGVKPADERFRSAVLWLVERRSLEITPGFEDLPPQLGWQRGLRFYYYRSLVAALPYFPNPAATDRRQTLYKLLLAEQRPNGSWQNESDRMRENDPLIATALAIAALALATGSP